MDLSDLEGVRIWSNPSNGWTVFEVHYSADPAKRSKEWIERIRCAMSRSQWEREYELKWQTYSGVRVFDDFSRKLHIARSNEEPYPGLPLLLGFDFGLTPACVIGQLVQVRLHIFDEMVAFNEPISTFSQSVKERLKSRYPSFEHITFVDPAGFQRNQVDGRRCVDILVENGFSPQPGAISWTERKESVIKLLTRTWKGEALLRINPRCEWLIAAMDGGYHYDEDIAKKEKPVKNEYSHISDALQYLTSSLDGMRRETKPMEVKRAFYGFQRRN